MTTIHPVNWPAVKSAATKAAVADRIATKSKRDYWGDTENLRETMMTLAVLWATSEKRVEAAYKAIGTKEPPMWGTPSDYGPEWEVVWVDATKPTSIYPTRQEAQRAARTNLGYARKKFNLERLQERVERDRNRYRDLLTWVLAVGNLRDVLCREMGEPVIEEAPCAVRNGMVQVSGVGRYLGLGPRSMATMPP